MFTNGTGTGKTYTGMGIAKRFIRQGKDRILIVVPSDKLERDWASAAFNLGVKLHRIEGLRDNGGNLPVVTTYAALWQNTALIDRPWDLMIMDESHNVLEGAEGEATVNTDAFRAHALDPRGAERSAALMHPKEAAPYYGAQKDVADAKKEWNAAKRSGNKALTEAAWLKLQAAEARLSATARVFLPLVAERRRQLELIPESAKPKVVFLSATPFSYELATDYAEGYLFNYPQSKGGSGYNDPNGRQQFMIQHFGWTMRNNKLTKPDAKVDAGLMQRQFNSWLKREGALAGRMLDVPFDYDRRFIAVNSELGNRIDQAWTWLFNTQGLSNEQASYRSALARYFDLNFDHVTKMRLLEALKVEGAIGIIKKHLAMGRKAVVYHGFIEGGVKLHPFRLHPNLPAAKTHHKGTLYQMMQAMLNDPKAGPKLREAHRMFAEEFPDLVNADLEKMRSPIEAITAEFGKRAVVYNGTVSDKRRDEAVMNFNLDDSGVDVFVIQSEASAGISLHDTTGEHARVLLNLGLPGKPVATIQQEGRVFRVGQASDAMMRYLNTGTRWERWAFADRIAVKADAVENLSMGEAARALRDSYIEAFEDTGDFPPGYEGEGTGGKERDRRAEMELSEFDRAKTFYWAQRKKNQKTKAAEGVDYFPTPEPLGLKMVEWLGLEPGDKGLEPSAGHGAIARWFGDQVDRTAIEQSMELASRMRLVFDGKLVVGSFEDHEIVNKYDGIAMNPPYNSPGSTGGKLAMDHVAKAFRHLKPGGRLIAIVPDGPAMQARLDKWMLEKAERPVNPKGTHPTLGPIYAGDVVTVPHYSGGESRATIRRAHENQNGYWAKLDGQTGEAFLTSGNITKIVARGPRTELVNEFEDGSLVAEVKMPSASFERAGTPVRTRLLVIDKLPDSKSVKFEARPPVDLSDSEDVNAFFDRIEHMTMPPRPKVVEEPAAAAPASDTRPKKSVGEIEQWEQLHGKTGETQYMVMLERRLSTAEYATVVGIARKLGGGWNSYENGYNKIRKGYWFPTAGARAEFIERLKTAGEAGGFTQMSEAPADLPDQQRRALLIGALAAAATNANAGTKLGRAQPVSPAALDAPIPAAVEKLLSTRGSGVTNTDGRGAVNKALDAFIASGPAELRELAKQIKELLPKGQDIWLTWDAKRRMNALGAVTWDLGVPHLQYFAASGGFGYVSNATFLHELLHIVVLARYRTLSTANDVYRGRRGIPRPTGQPAIDQLVKLWDEWEAAVAKNKTLIDELVGDDKLSRIAIKESVADPDEFFIRALTDSRLQRIMASVEYQGRSMWARFKDWVKTSLFGFKKEGTAPSWLDAALLASQEVLEAAKVDPADFAAAKAGKVDATQRSTMHSLFDGGKMHPEPEKPSRNKIKAELEGMKANAEIKQGLKEKAWDFVHRMEAALLDPLKTLPNYVDYLKERYLVLGQIGEIEKMVEGIRDVFRGAVGDDEVAAFKYLTTKEASPEGIKDKAVRDKAIWIKDEINKIGNLLVAKGLMNEASRALYSDAYLPRLYLRHLLNQQDWVALGAGKKPSNLGYLKKRKDIPESVRRIILGEITDPGFLSAHAIGKPLRDMALLDWLEKISHNTQWVLPQSFVNWQGKKVSAWWLASEAEQLRQQADYYTDGNAKQARALADQLDTMARQAAGQITGDMVVDYKQIPNTPRYGRLRGIYVRREIYDDLMGTHDFQPADETFWGSIFGHGGWGTKLTGFWKTSKVALNIPAQARNFVSNAILLQLSGVPILRVLPRLAQAAYQIQTNGKYWQIARKYGVTEATFAANELARVNRDLLELEKKQGTLSHIGALKLAASTVLDFAGDTYQKIEALFKTAKIIDAMQREGMSESDAALEAHKWLFDYSLVSPEVRYMRSAPVGAPFLTFTIKVLPRMMEVAIHHPQRFLPWVGLFYSIPYLVAMMTDADADDLDKLHLSLPKWMRERGHIAVMPFKDDDGRWQVLDLGYFMPWAFYTDLIPVSMRTARRTFEGDLDAARQSLSDDFASANTVGKLMGLFGGPVPDAIAAVKTNKDPFTGREIVPAGADPGGKFAATMNYLYEMMAPPMLTSRGLISPFWLYDRELGGKAAQAIHGDTNRFGEPRATALQASLYLPGINLYGVDQEKSRAGNIMQLRREIEDAQQLMVRKLQNRSLTDEEREAIIAEHREEIVKRIRKLQEYAERTSAPVR